MEDQLQQYGFRGDVNRLELTRLKPTPLVRIQAQISNSLEFNFVEWNLVCQGLRATRQKGKELNLGGHLALMRQKLERPQSHQLRKLNDDLLRIVTELLRLPPS